MPDSTPPLHALMAVSTRLLFLLMSAALEPQSLAYLLSCKLHLRPPTLSSLSLPTHLLVSLQICLHVIFSVKAFVIPNIDSLDIVAILFIYLGSGFTFVCIFIIGAANGFRKTNFKMRKCSPLFMKIEENPVTNFDCTFCESCQNTNVMSKVYCDFNFLSY